MYLVMVIYIYIYSSVEAPSLSQYHYVNGLYITATYKSSSLCEKTYVTKTDDRRVFLLKRKDAMKKTRFHMLYSLYKVVLHISLPICK